MATECQSSYYEDTSDKSNRGTSGTRILLLIILGVVIIGGYVKYDHDVKQREQEEKQRKAEIERYERQRAVQELKMKETEFRQMMNRDR